MHTKSKLSLLILLALFFVLTGLGCKTSKEAAQFPDLTLEYWGVFEDSGAIKSLTNPYSRRHPKIRLSYTKLREDEYDDRMLKGWALGEGPDLFMIPNTRIREFLEFITPMPTTMQAPVMIEQGTIKKETIEKVETYTGYTTRQLRDTFLDVVYDDVVINNQIYALPYSIDTLSVFYNRDILRANNIALPAGNWSELIEQAKIISKLDANDNLVQSTIALGTTENVPAAFDIMSTLMMQVGVEMSDARGARFQSNPESLSAIQFYLSFAQKGLQNYSWNDKMPNALEAFTSGKLAYFIGYPYHKQLIQETNPNLDFDIIPMFAPENAGTLPNYASYWVTVVAKPPDNAAQIEKKKAEVAWQYLFESTQARNVRPFLNNTANPRTTALRALVDEQKSDFALGPFAQNLLNARSWYRGYDYEFAEKTFLDMIDQVKNALSTNVSPLGFIGAAGDLISQSYTPRR
ncbi:MAG: extracellular solute-binding protein [Patescibacteria group bacterium]